METVESPLKGKRVLITRAKLQAKEFVDRIEKAGGVPITAPLLEIKANNTNCQEIQGALKNIKHYDCIVFTSANGVTFFKEYLDLWRIPYSSLDHLIAASVGRKTSNQMQTIGLTVSIIPEEYVAEKLTESISEHLPAKSRILVIRGNLARPALVTGLKNCGYDVTDLVVYETIHNLEEAKKLRNYILQKQLDFITFTSSSTVDSFMKILNSEELRESLQNVTFISIGPITNKTLLEYGFRGFMPASYTIEDMVKLMTELIK
jgi:uroporphyrinogen-III synthase